MSHHVWVSWVPLFHRRWGCLCRLGREPYPCYRDQEPCHSESHNLMYSTRMVKAGNGAEWPGLGQDHDAYQRLPRWLTIPKSNGPCMRFPLPILTGILARDAKPIGRFGMVARPLTIAYHRINLALLLSSETFTNHYHRGLGQGIDVSVVGGVVAGMAVW